MLIVDINIIIYLLTISMKKGINKELGKQKSVHVMVSKNRGTSLLIILILAASQFQDVLSHYYSKMFAFLRTESGYI